MEWTATHRFVLLALHLARQGDDEIQPEELQALGEAAQRIGVAAGIPRDDMDRMVQEALAAYRAAVDGKYVEVLVTESSESLGACFALPVRRVLVKELRAVAKAHGGVNRGEHVWLEDLRASWGVDAITSTTG